MGATRGRAVVKRTQLKRKPFEAHGKGLQRNKPMPRKRSTARTQPARQVGVGEGLARDRVKARSGGWCEMQVPGVCLGRATNWCHRVGKGQGGQWRASNGLAGCGSGTTGCHGWCHANPAAARERGWMLRRTEDPAAVPVLLPTGVRVLLDDVGDYLPVRAA